MMSLTGAEVVLEVPGDRGCESTSRCSAGPRPPTACDVSVEQRVDLLLGQHRQTLVGRVQRGTDLAGHRALGDRLTRLRYWSVVPSDTRSRYCSPMADTECTLADASTGILNWLSMLIVGPRAVLGGLDVGHLADRDAAVGHVGGARTGRPSAAVRRTACTARCRPRWATAGSTSPAPTSAMTVRIVNRISWILMKRVSIAHSPLSTSGPPGASCGFGVNRTSGIIVFGSRPQACSSARSMPEKPVPDRNAVVDGRQRQVDVERDVDVVAADHLRHVVDGERQRSASTCSAPIRYGDALPSCCERPLQVLQVRVRGSALAGGQRLVGGLAEPAERSHRVGEQVALCRRNA